METEFIIVTWPESQYFIGMEGCYLVNDDKGLDDFGSSAYFVQKDIYEKVIKENEL